MMAWSWTGETLGSKSATTSDTRANLGANVVQAHMDFEGLAGWPVALKVIDYSAGVLQRLLPQNPQVAYWIGRDHPLTEQVADMLSNPEGTADRHDQEMEARREREAGFMPADRWYDMAINEPPLWATQVLGSVRGIPLSGRAAMLLGARAEAQLERGLGPALTLQDLEAVAEALGDRYLQARAGMMRERIGETRRAGAFDLTPIVAYEWGIEATDRYTARLGYLSDRRGRHRLLENISVGWPNNTGPETAPDWSGLERSTKMFAECPGQLQGAHEYIAVKQGLQGPEPEWQWGWWAGRILKCPRKNKKLIGEFGIDQYVANGGVGHDSRGWQGQGVTPEGYRDIILEYLTRIGVDPTIVGVCLFMWDFYQPWGTFDVRPLRHLLQAIPIVERPAVPEPAVDTLWASLLGAFGARAQDLRHSLPVHPTLKFDSRALSDIRRIIIHHSATPGATTTWEAIARDHVSTKGWAGIGYHIGVDHVGNIAYLGDVATVRAHALGHNADSIGVCLTGNFEIETVPAAQFEALKTLVGVLSRWGGPSAKDPMIYALLGHRDVGQTACPGKNLYARLSELWEVSPVDKPAIETIRNVAWNHLYPQGIPYAPAHAFPTKAAALGLDQPLTLEVRFRQDGTVDAGGEWILQGYDGSPGKILWCRYGDWQNIQVVGWLA